MAPNPRPMYIYINGYPGVGKLTIARELAKLLPKAKVYHNHLMIDPIDEIASRSDPEYHPLRTELRRFLLTKFGTPEADRDTTYIFTDARESGPNGARGARDYEDAAAQRGIPFIPVVLKCDEKENVRRVVGRGGNLDSSTITTKLTNAETLLQLRNAEKIFEFGTPTELKLDVSTRPPEKTAQMIAWHVGVVLAQRRSQTEVDEPAAKLSKEAIVETIVNSLDMDTRMNYFPQSHETASPSD